MSEVLEIYWARLRNWGDQVTPIIAETLSGMKVQHSTKEGKYVSTGSILEHTRENDVIWGTGSMFERPARLPKGLSFHAVRGPLTRKVVMKQGFKCPPVYGDPAILMPYIYKVPREEIQWKIGIIPHYVDKKHVAHLQYQHPDVRILDIQAGIKDLMKAVAKCKVILSSSLHGVILAEAMGKKACYVQMDNKVVGGDFKFKDYYASTDRPLIKSDWRNKVKGMKIPAAHLSDAVDKALRSGTPHYNLEGLLMSCPFNFKDYLRPEEIPGITI